MVRPERRTPGDLMAAALIAVAVVVAGVIVWWTSDARATVSRPASDSTTNPPSATVVPADPCTGPQITISAGLPTPRMPTSRPCARAVLPVAMATASAGVTSQIEQMKQSWRSMPRGMTPVPPGVSVPSVSRDSVPRSLRRRTARCVEP